MAKAKKTRTVVTKDDSTVGKINISSTCEYWDAETNTYYLNDRSMQQYSVFNHYFDYVNRFESTKDIFLIMQLAENLTKQGFLAYRGNKNTIKFMNRKDIGEKLNLSADQLKRFMKRMLKNKIMYEEKALFNNSVRCKKYYINPAVVHKHSRISPEAYHYFKDDLFYLNEGMKNDLEIIYQANYEKVELNTKALEELKQSEVVDPEVIFNEYVLNNNPEYYHLGNKGMEAGYNKENCFYLVNTSNGKGRKATDIVEYNNLMLDIDAGKDDNKEYFKGEILAARKAKILDCINSVLPDYTALVETRNGYHVLYSIEATNNVEEWKEAQEKLVNNFLLADNIKDVSRVLRMPGTTWNKDINKYETFEVKVVDANPIRYSLKDLDKVFNFDELKEKSQEVAKELNLQRERAIKANKEGRSLYTKTSVTNKFVDAYKNHVLVSDFVNPFYGSMNIKQFKNFIREFDMRALYGLGNNKNVCCLLHDDKHPSAIVAKSEDNVYRMFCMNPDCKANKKAGADNIDVMQALTGYNFVECINYMSRLFGVALV